METTRRKKYRIRAASLQCNQGRCFPASEAVALNLSDLSWEGQDAQHRNHVLGKAWEIPKHDNLKRWPHGHKEPQGKARNRMDLKTKTIHHRWACGKVSGVCYLTKTNVKLVLGWGAIPDDRSEVRKMCCDPGPHGSPGICLLLETHGFFTQFLSSGPSFQNRTEKDSETYGLLPHHAHNEIQ